MLELYDLYVACLAAASRPECFPPDVANHFVAPTSHALDSRGSDWAKCIPIIEACARRVTVLATFGLRCANCSS